MEVETEALVIVAPGTDFERVIDRLRQVATLTQLLPPTLALVALKRRAAPPEVPGTTWYDESPPAAVLAGLSSEERLFVAAWAARLTGKARDLDGRPWDAPGLEPPDWPESPGTNP